MIPDYDILTAGFPCQSYSEAGNLQGLESGNGRLFFEIMRIVKKTKPRALFLENVSNLLKVEDGQNWDCIKSHIQDAGYSVHWKVINAA
jgi:DNA (cytosine-5)-methyltransferase 1